MHPRQALVLVLLAMDSLPDRGAFPSLGAEMMQCSMDVGEGPPRPLPYPCAWKPGGSAKIAA